MRWRMKQGREMIWETNLRQSTSQLRDLPVRGLKSNLSLNNESKNICALSSQVTREYFEDYGEVAEIFQVPAFTRIPSIDESRILSPRGIACP